MADAGRRYSVNIVGESYRQEAIGRTRVGEPVRLTHDPLNDHDDRAVAVFNRRGEQIGFLARESWLKGYLLDEGGQAEARVKAVNAPGGSRRHAAVVLEVVLG